jgi:predicted short-subunit dehydrogenase-like oxidoreductase (DUF2520 family)
MGQGIAIALGAVGGRVTLLGRSPRPIPAPLTLATPPWTAVIRDAGLLLIATPDDAIPAAARDVAALDAVRQHQVVLHLSGLLDRTALAVLQPTGAALGSFHPLQTVADPASAPRRLAGACAGVEGDARAIEAGERLARLLEMRPVRIAAAAKPLYHAAAVIAGNYPAALASVAERLARAAGIAPELAGRMYLPLIAGAAENLLAVGPGQALTGPVRRGDLETLRRHLAALPPDLLPLYRMLGLEAVQLAAAQGLDEASAAAVRRVLEQSSPGGEP